MSMNIDSLTLRFERFFRPDQAAVLAETIHAAYTDLVKTSDFNELSYGVNLAEAQERTEARGRRTGRKPKSDRSVYGGTDPSSGRFDAGTESNRSADWRNWPRLS